MHLPRVEECPPGGTWAYRYWCTGGYTSGGGNTRLRAVLDWARHWLRLVLWYRPHGMYRDWQIRRHAPYTCPVCGWAGNDAPCANDHICACCGVQFGYNDMGQTHAELRAAWIAGGMRWWFRAAPADYDPVAQLAGIGVTDV